LPNYLLHYLLIYLLAYLLTAVDLSLGGSRPYTGTDKTNKNKYTYTKQYKQYKTHYIPLHILPKHPHIHTPTRYKTS